MVNKEKEKNLLKSANDYFRLSLNTIYRIKTRCLLESRNKIGNRATISICLQPHHAHSVIILWYPYLYFPWCGRHWEHKHTTYLAHLGSFFQKCNAFSNCRTVSFGDGINGGNKMLDANCYCIILLVFPMSRWAGTLAPYFSQMVL